MNTFEKKIKILKWLSWPQKLRSLDPLNQNIGMQIKQKIFT